jgi:hypothetical protein
MAIEQGYSKIVTQGLKFSYDTGDTRNSYTGRPTANISAGIGMSTYNNVPGSVSSTLTGTGTYYRGAEIIRQDLTALDGSGASWLSGGNNPGIGVVTGGGGGTGGRYTGHSIFFKPTVPTTSCPVYTHYSNIGGWQSSCEYDDMGDGWFRARVIWYAGSTASDGKYWAINPLSTPTGATVTIYWAGPFKEDLNVTNVSQYINGTRSATQGLLDVSGKGNSMSLSDVSFDSSAFPQITFDGTNDYIDISSFAPGSNSTGTISAMVYPLQNSADSYVMGVGGNTTFGASRAIRVNGGFWSTVSYGSGTEESNDEYFDIGYMSIVVVGSGILKFENTKMTLEKYEELNANDKIFSYELTTVNYTDLDDMDYEDRFKMEDFDEPFVKFGDVYKV